MMRYKVPGKHSVFWKLACLLVAFCLLMIWLSWSWGRYMDKRTGFLSQEARSTLLPGSGASASLPVDFTEFMVQPHALPIHWKALYREHRCY